MEITKTTTAIEQKLDLNLFQLVVLLSKRAKELMLNAKPQIDWKSDSVVEIAIREVFSEKIKSKA